MSALLKNVIFPYTDAIYKAVITDSKVSYIIKEQNKNDFTVEYSSIDDINSELSRLEKDYGLPVGTFPLLVEY